MQTLQIIKQIKSNSLAIGIIHSTIIPLICIYAFNWYGLAYLLIPTVAYLTFKKDGIGKEWFFVIFFMYSVFLVSGLIDYSTTVGGY